MWSKNFFMGFWIILWCSLPLARQSNANALAHQINISYVMRENEHQNTIEYKQKHYDYGGDDDNDAEKCMNKIAENSNWISIQIWPVLLVCLFYKYLQLKLTKSRQLEYDLLQALNEIRAFSLTKLKCSGSGAILSTTKWEYFFLIDWMYPSNNGTIFIDWFHVLLFSTFCQILCMRLTSLTACLFK